MLIEATRKLLTKRRNKADKAKYSVDWASKYKTGRKNITNPTDRKRLRDFGIHLIYDYEIPEEYNLHALQDGYFAAHIRGQALVVKFEYDGTVITMASIGSHKDVYGATRRFG